MAQQLRASCPIGAACVNYHPAGKTASVDGFVHYAAPRRLVAIASFLLPGIPVSKTNGQPKLLVTTVATVTTSATSINGYPMTTRASTERAHRFHVVRKETP